MPHWTLESIDWDRFDPAAVNPDVLKAFKASAMVEANGEDYGEYLCKVFHDDPAFQAVAREWALEELQHGRALGRWAALADPSFNFEASFQRFTDGYKISLDVEKSVRGSRAGELIARCIVETGTSTYYTALADATDEPVLKAICRNIAADEFRHYKLFYSHLKRYQAREQLGVWGRLRVVLGRCSRVMTTSWPTPSMRPTSPTRPISGRSVRAPMHAAPIRSIAAPMSSAASPWR